MNLKRFLVFVCVCVCVVSLGLTTYYFLRDEERIFAENAVYNVNVGDIVPIKYVHENPRFGTEVLIDIQDKNIVYLDPVTNNYIASSGGKTIITISSNKKNFRNVVIEVNVGDGSFTTPFYVQSTPDLCNIGIATGKGLDKNYVLTSDLSLSESAWTPIGNGNEKGFTGTFNFNFKTISNLNIASDFVNSGLFAKIGENGVVKNLILNNVNISNNSSNVGVIAGICEGTIERSCVYSGEIVNNNNTSSNVGGIVGKLISKSSNYANVERCYSVCAIKANSNIGGLIGYNDGGKLANCFASKDFNMTSVKIESTNTTANIGGLIGLNTYSSVVNNLESVVLNCYASVKIESESTNKGALIGKNTDRDADNSKINNLFGLYFSSALSNVSVGASNITNGYNDDRQLVLLSTADEFITKTPFDSFKTRDNTVTHWDFENVWTRNSNMFGGYPCLNMNGASIVDNLNEIKIGNQIWNINDLNELRSSSEKWELMVDLDLGSIDNFTPIGTNETPFNGTLDGNGYKIYNLTINAATKYLNNATEVNNEYYGLFGVIGLKGNVYDLNLQSINISVGTYTGSLAGMNLGVVKNCNVIGNETSLSSLTSSYSTGGLIGLNTGTVTTSQTNYLNITGSTIANKNLLLGGLVGQNTATGNIKNCKVKENVNVTNEQTNIVLRAGGIAGENNNLISSCSFAGDIISDFSTKELTVGGIAGANYDDGTRKSYVSSEGTTLQYRQGQECEIEFCVSTGTITGYRVGGIAGYNLGDIKESQSSCTVKGVEAGGLIGTMEQGTIMDCLANCVMQGANAKSEKAGLVHFAYSWQFKFAEKATLASCVLNCFTFSTYDDAGVNYRETATSLYAIDLENTGIQFTDGYWINNLNDSEVANNAKQATRGLFAKKVELELTSAECKGTVNTFKVFIEKGFRNSVWNFTVGNYPTLKNVVSL